MMKDSLVIRACKCRPNGTVPVWFMRQAGRYMPEYRAIREKYSFLEMCKIPDVASRVTMMPVSELGVDAAIIFADILLVIEPMGLFLEFAPGPVIANPIRDERSISGLKEVDVEASLGFVLEAIRKVKSSLPEEIPLIGFSGAPFTIASYMIEGGASKDFARTKGFMSSSPRAWHLLMEKLSDVLVSYLNAQVRAGADLVQIFDSWIEQISAEDYEKFVLPYSKKVIAGVEGEVPVIHFGRTDNIRLLELIKGAGGDVIGIDSRLDIQRVSEGFPDVAIQGNLDPAILLTDPETIRKGASKILDAVGRRPGFIFNLGHGILPETPVGHVKGLVDFIHSWKV